MNAHFINIKVDREERPDIDKIYMQALQLLGEQGGWPLTMFLHPRPALLRRHLFATGCRDGRARASDHVLTDDQPTMAPGRTTKSAANGAALADALSASFGHRRRQPAFSSTRAVVNSRQALLAAVDPVHGGTEGRAEISAAAGSISSGLLARREIESRFGMAVVTTLARFARAASTIISAAALPATRTDARWLVPHFEKMLYDNAQLVASAQPRMRSQRIGLFRQRIDQTGRFSSSDFHGRRSAAPLPPATMPISKGEEGRYYVWTEDEIDRALGPDAAFFTAIYGVTTEGNLEGKNILNRLGSLITAGPRRRNPADGARDPSRHSRQRLHAGLRRQGARRLERARLAALADAGLLLDRQPWIDAASEPRRACSSGCGMATGCANPGAPGRGVTSPPPTAMPI